MQLTDAMQRLRDNEDDLKKMGVEALFMFGSTVRGVQTDDSDVDLYLDYDIGTMTLTKLVAIKTRATEILGCEADITTRDSLHPRLREGMEASALRVF